MNRFDDDECEGGAGQAEPRRESAGYYDLTGVMIVIGRCFEVSGTAEAQLAFFDRAFGLIDAETMRGVPAADLSRFEELEDGESHFLTYVVGVKVATGTADQGPSEPITLEQVRAAEKLAASRLTDVLWATLAESVGGARVSVGRQTQTYLVPFGPLAGGMVAFGRLADAEPAPAGLDAYFGQDMQQERTPDGVHGVAVGCGYDWAVATLDFSDDAHAERVQKLGPGAAYHVVARYD